MHWFLKPEIGTFLITLTVLEIVLELTIMNLRVKAKSFENVKLHNVPVEKDIVKKK